MMTCAALVLFMTLPGLALFYGGLVRRKERALRAGAMLRHRRPGHHSLVGHVRLQHGFSQWSGREPLFSGTLD